LCEWVCLHGQNAFQQSVLFTCMLQNVCLPYVGTSVNISPFVFISTKAKLSSYSLWVGVWKLNSHSLWVWEQGSSHIHRGSWCKHHVGWPHFYIPCSSDTVPHYLTLFINSKGSNKWTQVTCIWEVPSLKVAWDEDYLQANVGKLS
jgi:hypothetical protein